MSVILDNSILLSIASQLVVHLQGQKSLNRNQLIRYLESRGAIVTAKMLRVIPEKDWQNIAQLARRL